MVLQLLEAIHSRESRLKDGVVQASLVSKHEMIAERRETMMMAISIKAGTNDISDFTSVGVVYTRGQCGKNGPHHMSLVRFNEVNCRREAQVP